MRETETRTRVLGGRQPLEGQGSLAGVLRSLVSHPTELLLRRWNWKAALFSSMIRGLLFLGVNAGSGWRAAAAAGAAEFLYRAATAGFYGSVTQSFRRVEPPWHAAVAVLILLPAISHTVEFAIHWMRDTPRLGASIAASLCLTVLSTTFNLYAMRRGALVVGAGERSLWSDIKGLPGLIAGYLASGPLAIWRLLFRRTLQSML